MTKQYKQIEQIRQLGVSDVHICMLQNMLAFGATHQDVESLIERIKKKRPRRRWRG